MKLPAHESTTAQLGVAYPFAASAPLHASRVLIGQDLVGGPFAHDPFELYASGRVTNPNMTVLGQIGRGKSALVKTYLLRQAAFGRQVAVLDPKGEYGALARALGSRPVALAPGGAVRVNPLDAAAAPTDSAVARQRLVLLATLAGACLRRSLSPREHTALELALGAANTLPSGIGQAVLRYCPTSSAALLRPLAESARLVGTTKVALEEDGRDLGLELRRLVEGDLAGMFDGPTTPGIDPGSGVLVVDLSAVYHSEALGALMVCASAWLQAITAGARLRRSWLSTRLGRCSPSSPWPAISGRPGSSHGQMASRTSPCATGPQIFPRAARSEVSKAGLRKACSPTLRQSSAMRSWLPSCPRSPICSAARGGTRGPAPPAEGSGPVGGR